MTVGKSDLGALDVKIARLRGWRMTARGLLVGESTPQSDRDWWADLSETAIRHFAPPFSSSWALAGPLLEEMCEHGVGLVQHCDDDGMRWLAGRGIALPGEPSELGLVSAPAPCEAIARAWLAWRQPQVDGTAR